MTHFIEAFAERHFEDLGYPIITQRLSDGLTSEVYRIDRKNHIGLESPLAVTILRNPEHWWRIEQEQLIRSLIANDTEVKIPTLIDAGVDSLNNTSFAYIISELIPGLNLDKFLSSRKSQLNDNSSLGGLVHDLGLRLAALHRHSTTVCGYVGKPGGLVESWQRFITQELELYFQKINESDPDLTIGTVSIASLQETLNPLRKIIEPLETTLGVDTCHLGHGDARFANIMADTQQGESWRIAGMIDLEEVTSGDPEIDIAFIENWLHFSPYKADVLNFQHQFESGYRQFKQPSNNYDEKRFIYHALRSLAYLQTVFHMDIQSFIKADPRHVGYVEKHMQVVTSLARGHYLQDLDIRPLI
jgi:hypothetical protein